MSRALALLESRAQAPETIALLDAAFADPVGRSLGLTGPPGVGKSTLVNCLIREARAQGMTVGAIAVDPSSARTGGALLGDRARLIALDPSDQGVFVRSMAARGRLGGVSALAYPSLVLMQAVYDLVLVETVGVGQSETEISGIVDAVALCIQPASGDSLQFMKAGIMEIPDLAIVTKADIGPAASRAAADLRAALHVADADSLPVHLCSAQTGEGITPLFDAVKTILYRESSQHAARIDQAFAWMRAAIATDFGTQGLRAVEAVTSRKPCKTPFTEHQRLIVALQNSLQNLIF